jgi:hypothetical protein
MGGISHRSGHNPVAACQPHRDYTYLIFWLRFLSFYLSAVVAA